MLNGKKIIYGITGSIAAAKAPIVARELVRAGADVHCVLTKSAQKFTTAYSLSILSGNEAITDIFRGSPMCEVRSPKSGESSKSEVSLTSDSIPVTRVWHVHLGRSADTMLIAPCSATTLGKLRRGIYDNAVLLLASSLGEQTQLVIAPAMDEEMWLQPAVQENIAWLKSKGVKFIEPVKGLLASGNIGMGRMPEADEVVKQFMSILGESPKSEVRSPKPQIIDIALPLQGKHILITGGPTYEPIDPVRFIGNRSSGKMGAALATEAANFFGADVTLIMGPSQVKTPSSVNRIDVETASEMRDEVLAQLSGHDILIMSAAVSDFAASHVAKSKIKKTRKKELTLELSQTRDILKDVMGKRKAAQLIIGFALEGGKDTEEYALGKLKEKGLDMIVLNAFDEQGAGFGGDTNRITLFGKDGLHKELPLVSKTECARIILSHIAEMK